MASKYKVKSNNFYLESKDEDYYILYKKWKSYIGKGWYGFDLGGCPTVWYEIVDEFLDHVKQECPKFKILQIKLKYGGLRCYLDGVNEKIEKEIRELEEVLFDKKLIY